MGLEFEHRASASGLIERVWRSRSTDTTAMMSVARAHWDFVFWEASDGVHAGVQGPESRASRAPVPPGAEFLGVRIALGAFLPALPASALVTRFVELPVDGDRFWLGGAAHRRPRYGDAEEFVASLVRSETLLSLDPWDDAQSERTRQRRYLAAVGLPRRTVAQIARAGAAALRLADGDAPAAVAHECGYFDQPHLARSLRRFVGPSATELAAASGSADPLSLLYKTAPDAAR